MRINKAKLAAARRASMAADLAAAFIASGESYRCTAAVTYNPALVEKARELARLAIAEGLSFGNSQSNTSPRHVGDLALSDAARIVSAHYFPKVQA